MSYPQLYFTKPKENQASVPIPYQENENEIFLLKKHFAKKFARTGAPHALEVVTLPDEWMRHFVRQKKKSVAEHGQYGAHILDKWQFKVSAASLVGTTNITVSDQAWEVLATGINTVLHNNAPGLLQALVLAKKRRTNYMNQPAEAVAVPYAEGEESDSSSDSGPEEGPREIQRILNPNRNNLQEGPQKEKKV